ncbi:MAG: exodeoxyribonuclease V subunit gamma, partial [Candidatus Omnitrophica bacterium]|nr:exodeoxyribonuclease V subunit gamma [Candidatus Omnitrophota bacterium]
MLTQIAEKKKTSRDTKKLLFFPWRFSQKTVFLINKYLKNRDLSTTLYLTSQTSKLTDFQETFYRNLKINFPPDNYTLRTLAKRLLEENSPCRIISDVEKYVRLARLLRRNRAFWPGCSLPGMAVALSNFIREIKVHTSQNFDQLRHCGESYPWKYEENRRILSTALKVMEEYQNELAKERLLDEEDIYRQACFYVEQLPYRFFIVEGFYELPAYQRDFLLKILSYLPQGVFAFRQKEGMPVDVQNLILLPTLKEVKLADNWEEINLSDEGPGAVPHCWQYPTQEEEVKGIISLIHEALTDHPEWRPEDCLVVFPEMPKYRSMVKRIFNRYHLPYEMTPGFLLKEEASVSCLLELIRLAESFSWERLMAI